MKKSVLWIIILGVIVVILGIILYTTKQPQLSQTPDSTSRPTRPNDAAEKFVTKLLASPEAVARSGTSDCAKLQPESLKELCRKFSKK